MKSSSRKTILIVLLVLLVMQVSALHLQTAALYVDNLEQSNLNYYFSTMSPSSFYANINQFRKNNPSAQSCPPSFPYANYTNNNLSCFACDPLTNNPNLKSSKVLFNILTRQCQQCTADKTVICNQILNGTFVPPSTAQTNPTTPAGTQPTTTSTTTTTTPATTNPTPTNTATTPTPTTSTTSSATSPTTTPTTTTTTTPTTSSPASTTPTNPANPSSSTTTTTTTTTNPATNTPSSTPSTASTTTSGQTTTNPSTTTSSTTTTSTTTTSNQAATSNSATNSATSAPVNSNGCAPSRPFFNKATGLCDPCPEGTEFVTSKQTCQPLLYATSPTAPNLILSNQSQLVDLNLEKQKKNPQQLLQYCPADKPYASNNKCINCEKGQYFYVATSACITGCPQGTYYDSNVLACSPALYYSDVYAPWIVSQQGNYQTWKAKIENIAKSSPRMIVCPKNKPFEVNGTCISCPSGTYFYIDVNKCLPCGKNRYYEPKERKCLGIVSYEHSMKTYASSVI